VRVYSVCILVGGFAEIAGNAGRAAPNMLQNILSTRREILSGRTPTSSDMWSSSVYLNAQLRHRYSGLASHHSKNIKTFSPLVHFLSLSYWSLSRNRSLITIGYEPGQRSIDTTTQPIAPPQIPLPITVTVPFPNSLACNVNRGLFIHKSDVSTTPATTSVTQSIDVTCVHVPVTVHRSGQCRISYV